MTAPNSVSKTAAGRTRRTNQHPEAGFLTGQDEIIDSFPLIYQVRFPCFNAYRLAVSQCLMDGLGFLISPYI